MSIKWGDVWSGRRASSSRSAMSPTTVVWKAGCSLPRSFAPLKGEAVPSWCLDFGLKKV